MMRRYPDLSHHEQAAELERAAASFGTEGETPNEAAADVLRSLADYLNDTAGDLSRQGYQELAMAYVSAWNAAQYPASWTPETRRAVWRALADVGLTR